jgi:hypothetical protein
MSKRRRLADRRPSETRSFNCNGLPYTCTTSCFADGSLTEIFLGNAKAGSHSDSAAKDSAVVCSIALQYGVPLEIIRRALMRNADGSASGPLTAALDLIASDGGGQ